MQRNAQGWCFPPMATAGLCLHNLGTYKQMPANVSKWRKPLEHRTTSVNETVEFNANGEGIGNGKEVVLNLNTSVKEEEH